MKENSFEGGSRMAANAALPPAGRAGVVDAEAVVEGMREYYAKLRVEKK